MFGVAREVASLILGLLCEPLWKLKLQNTGSRENVHVAMETSLMFVGPSELPLVLLNWRKLSWNKRKAFGEVFPALQQETPQHSASCLPWTSGPFPLILWCFGVNAAAKRVSFLQSFRCGAAHGPLKLFVSEERTSRGQKSSGSTLNPEDFWNNLPARIHLLKGPCSPIFKSNKHDPYRIPNWLSGQLLGRGGFPPCCCVLTAFLWQNQCVDGFACF